MNINFKNSTVAYETSGSGPVVVWLHGFLETKEIWHKQLRFFDPHFTNVCIDLLGHGKSGSLGDTHTMQLQAAVVIAVLKQLNCYSCSIIGHSMGGYVALAMLETKEIKIQHLVLLNSTTYADTITRKLNRDRAIKLVATHKDSFISMGITNLFSDESKNQYQSEIKTLIARAKKMKIAAIQATINGMKNRVSRTEIFKDFSGKKLIIAGKKDPIIPCEDAAQESKKTVAHIEIINGGHMSYLEDAESINKLLFRFLG